MNAVYYTQNLRDLLWVLPIQRESGGIFCSEIAETAPLVRAYDASIPFETIHAKTKITVGRGVESKRLALKRKTVRLQLSQLARRFSPDVIVTTSNHPHAMTEDVRREYSRVKQVQAFHGVSSKNVKFNAWMSDFDLLLLPGKRERDKFAQMGVLEKTRYELIGHPKSDRVLRGEITQQNARAALGLPDAPTILYAPTHGALSSFFAWGESICAAIPGGCNIIIKPHPSLTTTGAAENARVFARVREAFLARGALWLPHEPDVMPLMAAADVLITDYSSVAEEFLIFDKPLIFADHLANAAGRDRAQRDKGDWDGIFGCGARVTQKEELKNALENALANPREYSQARTTLRDYVFENLDGHCAARAAAALQELCED